MTTIALILALPATGLACWLLGHRAAEAAGQDQAATEADNERWFRQELAGITPSHDCARLPWQPPRGQPVINPANELRAAADLLEPLAKAAQEDLETGDYWASYNPATAWWDGLTNGMGGASGDLAGAIPPTAVTELARWLRAEARLLTASTNPDWQESPSPHAVAFARAILAARRAE